MAMLKQHIVHNYNYSKKKKRKQKSHKNPKTEIKNIKNNTKKKDNDEVIYNTISNNIER